MSGFVGVLIFIISSILLQYIGKVSNSYLENYDLCRNSSGHRMYLEHNDFGILEAKNLQIVTKNETILTQECHLELISCPSCVIFINFTFLNLSSICVTTKNVDLNCGCEFINLSEHPYEQKSTKKVCGFETNSTGLNFKTITKNLNIQLIYYYENDVAFTAEYKSLRNRMVLSKDLSNGNKSSQTFLLSPFFPSYYAKDFTAEYIISCPTSASDNCHVRLMFSDFQVGGVSIMEFFDWNGQRLNVVTGAHFKPAILISKGPTLVVRFYANSGVGLGYKAQYSFVYDDTKIEEEYHTDCGGFVDNLGGGITMMNMVVNGTKKFYCFWIIKPPKTYLHFKTYLYLKIANFSEMEETSKIIVYQTTTSSGKILEVIRHPNSEFYAMNPREHIQPITTGFYVSFEGTFGTKSRLAIAYAAFSYIDCFSISDFLCENHRCIPRQLTCDGFDHCGDGSDETSCYKDSNLEPNDRRWYSRTPNYLFPKNDPYYDFKTAILIFIMSSLGLITFVSTLFILFYRINTRVRHEQDLQNHLQIITDLLEEDILEIESLPDDPPVYEAPPDYDEVIKIDSDANLNAIFKPQKRKQSRKKKRSRYSKTKNTDKNSFYMRSDMSQSSSFQTDVTNGLISSEYTQISSEDAEKNKRRPFKNNPLMYFSDKAISSNVRCILKKPWHSQGELNHDKPEAELFHFPDCNLKTGNIKRVKISNPKPINSAIPSFSRYRETASDSELLNIELEDVNVNYLNKPSGFSCQSYYVNFGQNRFDYFTSKSCKCEGACGCFSTDQNNSENVLKPVQKLRRIQSKKNNSKLYTG